LNKYSDINVIRIHAHVISMFVFLVLCLLYVKHGHAGTLIIKKSLPGVIIKVVEVQGPNITELGGSIPAFHDLQIKADDGDAVIHNLYFTNMNNMAFDRMENQQVKGMHLGRAQNNSFYKIFTPVNSWQAFSWKMDLSYRYKGREYTEIIPVRSSGVKKEKPRFRKDDGTAVLAASLGLGKQEDKEITSTGDIYSGLEEELNLSSPKYDANGRFISDLDIALAEVEPHVERMRMINSHNAMLADEAETLQERAKAIDKAMMLTAEIHRQQDAEARRQAAELARREQEKNDRTGTLLAGGLSMLAGKASGLSTTDALEVGTRMMRKYDNDHGGGNSNLIAALEATKNSFQSIEETNRKNDEFHAKLRDDLKRQQRRNPGVEKYQQDIARIAQLRGDVGSSTTPYGSNTRAAPSRPKLPATKFGSRPEVVTKKRSRFDINWCCFSLSCGPTQEARDWESKGIMPGAAKYPNNQACNGDVWSKSYRGGR